MSNLVKALKHHPVSETHGYAVETLGKGFAASFVRTELSGEKAEYVRETYSYHRGKLLVFDSAFVADRYVRAEILPLYPKKAAG